MPSQRTWRRRPACRRARGPCRERRDVSPPASRPAWREPGSPRADRPRLSHPSRSPGASAPGRPPRRPRPRPPRWRTPIAGRPPARSGARRGYAGCGRSGRFGSRPPTAPAPASAAGPAPATTRHSPRPPLRRPAPSRRRPARSVDSADAGPATPADATGSRQVRSSASSPDHWSRRTQWASSWQKTPTQSTGDAGAVALGSRMIGRRPQHQMAGQRTCRDSRSTGPTPQPQPRRGDPGGSSHLLVRDRSGPADDPAPGDRRRDQPRQAESAQQAPARQQDAPERDRWTRPDGRSLGHRGDRGRRRGGRHIRRRGPLLRPALRA